MSNGGGLLRDARWSSIACASIPIIILWKLNTIVRFSMNCFRCFPIFAARSLPTSAASSSIPVPFQYNDGFSGFESPSHPRKAEIIFFHDIDWEGNKESSVQSWMTSSEPSVCWPQAWLSPKYNARILFACYDAGVCKTATRGRSRRRLIAENLQKDVCSIYDKDCPIFLVGHGLGGLIIKELVRFMAEQLYLWKLPNSTFKDSKDLIRLDLFLKNLKGICYFNTPVLGSKLDDAIKNIPERSPLSNDLELLSPENSILNQWFQGWRCSGSTGCRTTAIWADQPTNVSLQRQHWKGRLVEEASARPDCDTFYAFATDHSRVCKLSGETDSRLHRLRELIEREIDAIAQGHVGCSDGNACVELVDDILKSLQTPQQGGLFLIRDKIEIIRKIPELLNKLEDGLRGAGLVKADENEDVESWQPLHIT